MPARHSSRRPGPCAYLGAEQQFIIKAFCIILHTMKNVGFFLSLLFFFEHFLWEGLIEVMVFLRLKVTNFSNFFFPLWFNTKL